MAFCFFPGLTFAAGDEAPRYVPSSSSDAYYEVSRPNGDLIAQDQAWAGPYMVQEVQFNADGRAWVLFWGGLVFGGGTGDQLALATAAVGALHHNRYFWLFWSNGVVTCFALK
jgi:hypothetical protein